MRLFIAYAALLVSLASVAIVAMFPVTARAAEILQATSSATTVEHGSSVQITVVGAENVGIFGAWAVVPLGTPLSGADDPIPSSVADWSWDLPGAVFPLSGSPSVYPPGTTAAFTWQPSDDLPNGTRVGFQFAALRAQGTDWSPVIYVTVNQKADRWIDVSLSGDFGLAIDDLNRVVGWGSDSGGVLSGIPADELFMQVSAGYSYACGVTAAERVRCWGANGQHQVDRAPTDSGYVFVSAGRMHACATKYDGSAVCWGRSAAGQLAVPTGYSWIVLQAGYDHTCGMTSAGMHCWGGQTNGATPSWIPGFQSSVFTFAVGVQDTCWSAGGSVVTCLGRYSFERQVRPPATVPLHQSLVMAEDHTCALSNDGIPVCWGEYANLRVPPAGRTFQMLTAAKFGTCGLTPLGELLCWGRSASGLPVGWTSWPQ